MIRAHTSIFPFPLIIFDCFDRWSLFFLQHALNQTIKNTRRKTFEEETTGVEKVEETNEKKAKRT